MALSQIKGTIVRHEITARPKMGGPRKYPLPKIGDKYGELIVTGYVVGADGYPHAKDKAILVKCSCGSTEHATKSNWLDSGKLKGCLSCSRKRAVAVISDSIGYIEFFDDHASMRAYLSRLEGIKRRCYRIKDERYPSYGGRGIRCWWYDQYGKDAKHNSKKGSAVWKREMLRYLSQLDGWGDHSLQIDRIDVNGDYAPGNLRLVTGAENTRNRRRVMTLQEENDKLKKRVAQLESEIASYCVVRVA